MKSSRLSSSLLLVGVVFAALLTVGNAYGTGAPTEACEFAQPTHVVDITADPLEPIDPQTVDSPYSFTVDVSEYNPGGDLEVTIVGANDAVFQGFLLQARTIPGGVTVGTFTAPTGDTIGKLLPCTNAGDTVTHTNANDKASGQTFTWNAPAVGTGNIQFIGTVAVNHEVFYSAIVSETLTEGAAVTDEPMEPTTAITSDAMTEEFTFEMTTSNATTMTTESSTQANMEMTTGNAVGLSSGFGIFIIAMIASIIQLFV